MEAENNSSSDDSDHHHSSSSRTSKSSDGKVKTLDLDRISNLPNPMLLHILSFLPTKYAARTSVLSKKWQHLWTHTPILDFHDCRDIRHCYKNLNSFVSCIHRSLILHKSPKINKFRVVMHYNKSLGFDSDVDVWLRYATSKNVEELELNFYSYKVYSDFDNTTDDDVDDDDDDDVDNVDNESLGYLLPMNMLSNNSSLTTLRLKNCDIIFHGRLINWKSLKVLSLSQIHLNDSLIAEMLSGCPSLELLELLDCCNYEFLDIKSERLRKLVISECQIPPLEDALPLKILAPYLQSLEISGYLYEYSVINSSLSLVDAKLNFYLPMRTLDLHASHDKYTKNLVQLLENLRHVKDLTVGVLCSQVLSMLKEEVLPCPLSSVVCLRVNTSLFERDLPGITRLLRHTPLIETLVLNLSAVNYHVMYTNTESLYDLGGENYWSSQKSSFASALLNLKTVRIIGFGASKTEVELLLFLLKSASVLEKMIIHALNTKTVSLKYSLEVAQRLLSFPRCSKDAVVLFA